MAKKNKTKTVSYMLGKQRNYHAISAWNRSGSGYHPGPKAASKKACRGKVKDYQDL